MSKRRLCGVLALGLMLGAAHAQTTAWTYQGQLKNAGNPVSGNYDFRFELFSVAGGGAPLGTVNSTLSVSGGLFNATLDFGNLFPGANRWLQISVRPTGIGGYTTLAPRQPITPAPYAIGLELPFVGATNSGAIAFSISNGNDAAINGTSTLAAGVFGINTGNSSIDAPGVYGLSTFTNGNGVVGVADTGGAAYGVYGEAYEGYGVYGFSVSGTGVTGSSDSSNGAVGTSNSANGVRGINYASSDVNAAGVYGEGVGVAGNGVTGRADNGASAYGVYGTAAAGYGVYGDSNTGTGVYAYSNTGYGVDAASSDLAGVHGVNYNSADPRSAGVVGEGVVSNGNGVSGIANTGGAAYGVYGESATGYAGYFAGNVIVTGTLSKGGGSFRIDHPLDPANKYLSHSFVESPDMKNVYDGVVTTDTAGYATVTLPDWFDSLNRDFRYQLTIVDEANSDEFVQAKIVAGIADDQFTLRTSAPRTTVSWQVTGIRQDPWANAHRIPVEQTKPALERGLYLYPDLYGQSDDLGMKTVKTRAAAENPAPAPLPRPAKQTASNPHAAPAVEK